MNAESSDLSKVLPIVVPGALALFIIVGAVVVGLNLDRPPDLPSYSKVPDFSLESSDGGVVTLADLRGKVWVADFIFTSCAGTCPRMSEQMARLQTALDEVKASEGVKFVSFSVDPERDTPARLAEYAKRFEADPSRWRFLTGKKGQVQALARQGFLLASGGPGVPGGEDILHSSRFALVDKKGRVRGFYDGIDADAVEPLVRDIQALLR